MARVIEKRIKVSGTLVAKSPIHVGGINNNPEVDLALSVNGQGDYYIPGTSLAGALRAWTEECFDQSSNKKKSEHLSSRLWGFQEKIPGRDGNIGYASFVIIEDAVIKLPSGSQIEVRDGVGIDREYGSAADQIKYDRAIIPRGATFKLQLTVELPQTTDLEGLKVSADGFLNALDTLLVTLQAGSIRIGAAKTRGLGKICLKDCKRKEQNLLKRSELLETLRALKVEGEPYSPNVSPIPIPLLNITIQWKPTDPLMVKAGQDGIAVDILPLVSAVDQKVALVLPGSSIKGVLRSQAERILRTVLNLSAKVGGEGKPRFQGQLEDPKLRLTQLIFGAAAREQAQNGPTPQLGLGALAIDDCYCSQPIEPNQWQAIAAAKDSKELLEALGKTPLKDTQQAFHVAVDRWTGGAADGFLYSNLEPFGLTWDEIGLSLRLNRIPQEEQAAAIALLLLTLRDLAAGRIPLGYGVNRGMGAIAVQSITLQGQVYCGDNSTGLDNVCIQFTPQGSIEGLDPELLNCLDREWGNWITKHQSNPEAVC